MISILFARIAAFLQCIKLTVYRRTYQENTSNIYRKIRIEWDHRYRHTEKVGRKDIYGLCTINVPISNPISWPFAPIRGKGGSHWCHPHLLLHSDPLSTSTTPHRVHSIIKYKCTFIALYHFDSIILSDLCKAVTCWQLTRSQKQSKAPSHVPGFPWPALAWGHEIHGFAEGPHSSYTSSRVILLVYEVSTKDFKLDRSHRSRWV